MRISERGQITIPKRLRDRFGMNRNVEVEIVPADNGLLIRKRSVAGRSMPLRPPIDVSIAWDAGRRWLEYRRAGGRRTRIITGILIGAHATAAAENFVTRDRGSYRNYFPELAGRMPIGGQEVRPTDRAPL